MAVKVVEVELTQPIPDLRKLDTENYTHVQMLVRQRSTPVGYLRLPVKPAENLGASTLRQLIENELAGSLNRIALNRALYHDNSHLLAPEQWPDVTVAVCTRGRAESLRRTMASLIQLDYPEGKLELLVIDNAPADDSTAIAVACFPEIRYILEPRPGLNWARNRAIAEATGEIVAFTDDDVVVDALWLQAMVPHFANAVVACVTGLVVPAELETRAQNLFEAYGGFGRGFEMHYYTRGSRREWRYWTLGAGIYGTGCNMAYRRTLLEAVGRFDTALDVGTPTQGCGDHDMYYRTLQGGYILVYEPAAIVWHYHRRDLAQLEMQLHNFGRGVYAYLTKIFLNDKQMRWRSLAFALIWYWLWFVKRFIRPGGFPRKLVLLEALGACLGPITYLLSRVHARRVAQRFQGIASGVERIPMSEDHS